MTSPRRGPIQSRCRPPGTRNNLGGGLLRNRSDTVAASYDISCTAAPPHGRFPNRENYRALTRSLCHCCIFHSLPRYLALVCKLLGHKENSRTTVGLRRNQRVLPPKRPDATHQLQKHSSRVDVQTTARSLRRLCARKLEETGPRVHQGGSTHVALAGHGERGPAGEACGGGAAAKHRAGGHRGHPGAPGRTAGPGGR